jgi:hypothetical protein
MFWFMSKAEEYINPVVYCNNAQTVGIVTKSSERLHNKLKHVENHIWWIQQAVNRGELNVQ